MTCLLFKYFANFSDKRGSDYISYRYLAACAKKKNDRLSVLLPCISELSVSYF